MLSLKNEARSTKIILGLLIMCTAVASLFCIFAYESSYFIMGDLQKWNNDDVRYIRTALVLLEKGMLIDYDVNVPTIAEMPGHAFILAALFKLFGMWGGITAFRLLQVLLQALCLLLLFLLGRTIFGSKVALIACIIDAVYLPEIVSTTFVLTEIEFKFLIMLLIYITIWAIRTRELKYYVAGAIVWGLSCYIRPTAATFPIVVLAMWILYKYSLKEIARYTAVVTGIFCIMLAPWWIRNYLVFDSFIPMTLSSGNPFLQGTYINYDQSKDYTPYILTDDAVKNDEIEMETGRLRLKTYFKKRPLDYMWWYSVGKTWRLWDHPYYWRKILGVEGRHVLKYHRIIISTAILGMLFIFAGKHREGIYIAATVLYFNIIHIPYYTFSRYAYPIMPLVILMAVFFLTILKKLPYKREASKISAW